MTSRRKQIRYEVSRLLKGKTLAGENVYPSRITPLDRKSHPTIGVYSTNEIIQGTYSDAPLNFKRDLTIVCEITVSNSEDDNNAADQADDIADQIENIIFKEEGNTKGKLGCLVDMIRLAGVDTDYGEYQGESAVLSLRVAFACTYNKDAVDSEYENVTELKKIGAEWNIGTANDPDPEAEDIINVGT